MRNRLLSFGSSGLLLLACTSAIGGGSVIESVEAGPQAPGVVCQGAQASCVVTVARSGTGAGDIYLSAPDLPAGVTAVFSPNPLRFSNGALASMSATMLLSTSTQTPPWLNTFHLVARDGKSPIVKTNVATLNVTLCAPGAAMLPNGCVCVAVTAPAGQSCDVQATTNLLAPAVWTTLCSTNGNTNGLVVFIDADSNKYPQRFYRTAMP